MRILLMEFVAKRVLNAQTCSSCRRNEAAFGGEAVVKPEHSLLLTHLGA